MKIMEKKEEINPTNQHDSIRLIDVMTNEGKSIAFSVDQKGKNQLNNIILTDYSNKIIFSITQEVAKNLLKQLEFSISICEYFNLLKIRIPF